MLDVSPLIISGNGCNIVPMLSQCWAIGRQHQFTRGLTSCVSEKAELHVKQCSYTDCYMFKIPVRTGKLDQCWLSEHLGDLHHLLREIMSQLTLHVDQLLV